MEIYIKISHNLSHKDLILKNDLIRILGKKIACQLISSQELRINLEKNIDFTSTTFPFDLFYIFLYIYRVILGFRTVE